MLSNIAEDAIERTLFYWIVARYRLGKLSISLSSDSDM